MAITLSANYQKRLGLPGYSSHSFSASVETELTDLGQVQGEVTRLYGLLQDAVDREIQQVGFLPDENYAAASAAPAPNGCNGNEPVPRPNGEDPDAWQCSEKQRKLIGELAGELNLTPDDLDGRAQRLFQLPARQLNKLAASGLISDLLAEAGTKRQQRQKNRNGNGRPRRRPVTAGGGSG